MSFSALLYLTANQFLIQNLFASAPFSSPPWNKEPNRDHIQPPPTPLPSRPHPQVTCGFCGVRSAGELRSMEERNVDTPYSIDNPCKHNAERSQAQRPRVVWLHLYEMWRTGKSIDRR